MKGKIIDTALIIANDDKRYSFDKTDIVNLSDKSIDMIIGSEVDFEIEGDKAKSIYITKAKFNVDAVLKGSDINSIKIKAYTSLICGALGLMPFVGFVFSIISFVAMILAILAINKNSQSKTLLRNYVIYFILIFFGGLIISTFSAVSVGLVALSNDAGFLGLGFGVIFGFIVVVAGLIFGYLYYKELSSITNEPFFLYAFTLLIIGKLTTLIFIGFIFVIAAIILEIIAWVRFKEIRQVA